MIADWEQPAAGDVVALTFDDGPNPAVTNAILDTLKATGVRATFFLNSRSSISLRNDDGAKSAVAREVAEGHVIGNHTAHHLLLSTRSPDEIEEELSLLEQDVRSAAPCAPPLTLVRAPFGSPYTSAGLLDEKAKVYPIVARHGVHVAWSIDPEDYDCTDTACVVDGVLQAITRGVRGPILLHDTKQVTADALPQLIAELKKRGLALVTAEKLVRDKYGKPSAALVKR